MPISIFRRWNTGSIIPATIPEAFRGCYGGVGKYLEVRVKHILSDEDVKLLVKGHQVYKTVTSTFRVTANPELVPGSSNLLNMFECSKGDDILALCEIYFRNYLASLRKKLGSSNFEVDEEMWVFRIYAEKYEQ